MKAKAHTSSHLQDITSSTSFPVIRITKRHKLEKLLIVVYEHHELQCLLTVWSICPWPLLLVHFRYTFGSNTHGQLGRPTSPESPAEKHTAVAELRGRKVTHIASGDYFTVALVESGPEGLEVRTCACACPRASFFSRCCHQTPTTLRDKQPDLGQALS